MRFSLIPKEKVFYDLLENLSFKAEESVKLFGTLISSWNSQHPGVKGQVTACVNLYKYDIIYSYE